MACILAAASSFFLALSSSFPRSASTTAAGLCSGDIGSSHAPAMAGLLPPNCSFLLASSISEQQPAPMLILSALAYLSERDADQLDQHCYSGRHQASSLRLKARGAYLIRH